ncbi:hypothetical protein ZIOFF_056886 [Zingiber officinale]|uniref:beta-ketoacyl-[acyl-carrier-protein] synthase I n=1 Tax=Zingiber officinale TaxID=94328 RepID=A0A8J5FPB3_ZINOF|nr:hypothetical protein ZIOFF_056886 [Zingiber officinale]
MAGAAVASPLCAWIAAAACLSSSSSPATARSDQTRRGARRVGAGPRRSRCFPAAAIPSGGLRGSGIHSLLRSYLAFEPCPDFYRSCGVDGHGNRSSLIGPWKADVHRRRPRMSAASGRVPPRRAISKTYADSGVCGSGKLITVALGSAKELVGNKNLRRVVVTGMGVVTPLGHDPDIFYNNLLEGISGISEIEAFDCSSYPTRIAGEIKSFSTDGWVAPKLVKRMDNFMLYLLTAAKKALEDGGVTEEVMSQFEKTKCGVLIGSALGGMKIFNDALEALRVSYKKISPFSVPLATTNMGSAMLAIDLGWMGPNYSISTACATSNFCILNAANHIIRGEADVMLCGGSDAAIIPIGLGGFVACKALSQRNNDPQKASRPWDVDRDGFVIGEGAGVLLLEELEHAKLKVNSTKSMIGHLLGAAGAVEAVAVVQLRNSYVLSIRAPVSPSVLRTNSRKLLSITVMPGIPFLQVNASQNYGSMKLMIGSPRSIVRSTLPVRWQLTAIRTGWVHPNINLDNPEESVVCVGYLERGKMGFRFGIEHHKQKLDVDRLVSSRKERLDVKLGSSRPEDLMESKSRGKASFSEISQDHSKNRRYFSGSQQESHPTSVNSPIPKKQVRRRLHASKPYQERLLNMAEARREIVTALKLHRATMKHATEVQKFQQHQQNPTPSPTLELSPAVLEEIQKELNENRINFKTHLFNYTFPTYLQNTELLPCKFHAFPWMYPPITTIPVYDKLNNPFFNHPLGLDLNLQCFNNKSNPFSDNLCWESTIQPSSQPTSSSSNSPNSSIPNFQASCLSKSSCQASCDALDRASGAFHPRMDPDEIAEIHLIGEQHDMEWNDKMNMMTSAWWSKLLRNMDGSFCESAGGEKMDSHDEVFNMLSCLSNGDARKSCLSEQHMWNYYNEDNYLPDATFP